MKNPIEWVLIGYGIEIKWYHYWYSAKTKHSKEVEPRAQSCCNAFHGYLTHLKKCTWPNFQKSGYL